MSDAAKKITEHFEAFEFSNAIALMCADESIVDLEKGSDEWMDINTMMAISFLNVKDYSRALLFSDKMIEFLESSSEDFDDEWIVAILRVKFESLLALGRRWKAFWSVRKYANVLTAYRDLNVHYQSVRTEVINRLHYDFSRVFAVTFGLYCIVDFFLKITGFPLSLGIFAFGVLMTYILFKRKNNPMLRFLDKVI